MTGYDIIGDVHGCHYALVKLLKELGYEKSSGAWRHPDHRQVVFVGDLIDRGPEQLDVLRTVRAMVEAGSAQVILGNHEFNAIAYATVDPIRLDYARPHSDKNRHQHKAFLADVPFGSPLHRSIIDWFMEMPLWLELDELRVVHACWNQRDIDQLHEESGGTNRLTEQMVVDGATKGTPTYRAIETVLKGPEVHLDGAWFRDKDGHRRDDARLRWWRRTATTLREAALIPGGSELFDADDQPIGELSDRPLRDDEMMQYEGEVPVLFGHYWWTQEIADEEFDPLASCLDLSVAKGGPLRAYRWCSETELDPTKFVAV